MLPFCPFLFISIVISTPLFSNYVKFMPLSLELQYSQRLADKQQGNNLLLVSSLAFNLTLPVLCAMQVQEATFHLESSNGTITSPTQSPEQRRCLRVILLGKCILLTTSPKVPIPQRTSMLQFYRWVKYKLFSHSCLCLSCCFDFQGQ